MADDYKKCSSHLQKNKQCYQVIIPMSLAIFIQENCEKKTPITYK